MEELISKVLNRTGYPYLEPTEDNLIYVFLEYVEHKVLKEFQYDQVKQDLEDGDITLKMICHSLMSVR